MNEAWVVVIFLIVCNAFSNFGLYLWAKKNEKQRKIQQEEIEKLKYINKFQNKKWLK